MSGHSYAKAKKPNLKAAVGPSSVKSPVTARGSRKDESLTQAMAEAEANRRLGPYQLMEAIGRGGFGIVYRGLNIETGLTVAIKRVTISGTPKDELENIEGEIRLLQNLKHPNIVQYVDALRSADFLNIVLEYMESGALSGLLSKMGGKLPESLTAIYIVQVLKGLQYLHTQGVIHRDIKGANILSTKEGLIKLADFGVATKLNESRKSDSVVPALDSKEVARDVIRPNVTVGTPYWMAPEAIRMTGQESSACDIWSVGCTVIELITGKPPYFDLQPHPALFRIVQDAHPPLPKGISAALEDFLMQCFQKDPNRRIDAAGLLKHQWLKAATEELESRETSTDSVVNQTVGGGSSDAPPPESESKSPVPGTGAPVSFPKAPATPKRNIAFAFDEARADESEAKPLRTPKTPAALALDSTSSPKWTAKVC